MKGCFGMEEKVLLILVDGMRPDAVLQCKNPFLARLMQKSTYTTNAQTVMPSVTLPCHASLFMSVDPERHGITDNTWIPLARPIEGIADVIARYGKTAAFFYNWEQLRDLARPGSLKCSYYQDNASFPDSDGRVTDKAIEYMKEVWPDFVFLYLGQTDECGHAHGWLSEEYMDILAGAISGIERIYAVAKDRYSIIVTADHGGHDRNHGTDRPEDMTIPLILHGAHFKQGVKLQTASIKDIAPTVTSLMGLPKPREWEGHCLVQE